MASLPKKRLLKNSGTGWPRDDYPQTGVPRGRPPYNVKKRGRTKTALFYLLTYHVIRSESGAVGIIAFQDLNGDEALVVFVASNLDTCRFGKD